MSKEINIVRLRNKKWIEQETKKLTKDDDPVIVNHDRLECPKGHQYLAESLHAHTPRRLSDMNVRCPMCQVKTTWKKVD